MNLLFTSVGRRGYLLDYFKAALAGQGEVHATNSSADAPGLLYADRTAISPPIYSDEYIPFLLSYCRNNAIRAVIPLFDLDLPVLAGHRERFREIGVTLIVSSPEVSAMCNDKLRTYDFLAARGFAVPRTFATLPSARQALADGTLSLPLFIKPRWGMGSIGIYAAERESELQVLYDKALRMVERSYLKYESAADPRESVLIQEFIDAPEFGLDVVNNLDGAHEATLVKRKIAMRAGETDSAETVDDPLLRDFGRRLAACLGHVGNLDVDVFKVGGRVVVLELNPRFGGGYPFSHVAGADVPRAIIAWLQGRPTPPGALAMQPGVRALKDIRVIRLP